MNIKSYLNRINYSGSLELTAEVLRGLHRHHVYIYPFKQNDPHSCFVKNLICTKPTADGRFTIFNQKFISTKVGGKSELTIRDDAQLKTILKEKFNIFIE